MDILPSLRAVPTIEQIAEVLLSAPADVPWSYEGRCRHTIRRTLILVAGMAWKPADREARRLVANGRLTGGIRVPTGFDHNDIAIWIKTKRCEICDGVFEPRVGWHRYCSDRCKWHAKRIQERPLILGRCGFCTEIFETNQPQKIFCSTKCQRKAASQRASSRTGYVRIRVRMDRVRAKAEREAADLANPRHCAECGTLLPPGCDRRKIYCSTRCNTAVQNRKKLNGHAPQPTPDRPDPARSGNGSCRGPDGARRGPKEQPKYTPLEALQIAKSRCVTLMLAAIDAAEARRRREFRPWRRRSWDRKQKEPRGLAAAK